jgi:RNA polymerase sigma factor (sigma-70 family)
MSDIALPIAGVPPGLALPGRLLSDERLAKLASAGSERALAVLYERHHQALYRYCRSIVRDHEDAQDALQNTMTRAFAALQASERDLAVRPWLFRIAHNAAVSILRKRRPDDSLVDEHEPSDISVERTVDQRERLSMLVADLKALPERQRAALLMRELSGLSIEEIAAALSVSPGAAKQTVFEARSSLHEFAEGRAMECETVRGAISDGDGRVLRGRGMRAHLRECAGCRDFGALIDTRRADLRVLAPPLPATAAAAMLARLLAHGGAGHAGGAAAASGAALGNHAAASLVVKGLVGVVVVAAATAGTVHLARDPAKHKHTSTVVSPGAAAHAGAVGRAGAVMNTGARGNAGRAAVAKTPKAHSTAVARAMREASRTPLPIHGGAMTGPHGATGNPHRTSGDAGRRSKKVQLAPRGPKQGRRAHRPSTPVGPSASPRSRGPHSGKPRGPSSEGGGSKGGGGGAHTPQAGQAPAGQPAGAMKGRTGRQAATAPVTPPATYHGRGGK